jgi:hypothetical protein
MFSKTSAFESGAGPPDSKTQAWWGGAFFVRQVLDCAAPAALWARVARWFTPRLHLRRYRVLPDRKASAFRREVLAGVIHNLKRDSYGATHG